LSIGSQNLRIMSYQKVKSCQKAWIFLIQFLIDLASELLGHRLTTMGMPN